MPHSSHMTPTVCPPVEVDESIAGYIFRVAHANGRARMKGMVDELFDRKALQPPWTVPSNLEMLCRKLAPVFESADQIVRDHTCLPAHLPFAKPASLPKLLGHVLRGDRAPGIASTLGLAAKGISSCAVLGTCAACAEEDDARLGFTYWRREHQLAGLGYCP